MHPHRPWSELPIEILDLFLDRLCFSDHARFGAVCKPWRSVAAKHRHHQALQLPWLVLSQDPTTLTWGFFSLREGCSYHLNLPVPRGGRCFGSSYGWLLMNHGIDVNVGIYGGLVYYLLNPLTNQQIQLPHFMISEEEHIELCTNEFYKAILSSAPTADNIAAGSCVVVALYTDGLLFFCRPDDQLWSKISTVCDYQDFIFHEGLLYAVNDKEEFRVFKFDPLPALKEIHCPTRIGRNLRHPRGYTCSPYFYLVESAGELLMVLRYMADVHKIDGRGHDEDYCRPDGVEVVTSWFEVFKLDPCGTEWVQVKSLGDKMLFLGTGCSKSLTAESSSPFKGNCIYFTEDQYIGVPPDYNGTHFMDWGVFCLEDGSIQPYYPSDSQSHDCQPLWLILNA